MKTIVSPKQIKNLVWSHVAGNNGDMKLTDDEDVLLGAHAVHLSEDLVDDTIGGAAGVGHGPAAGLGDRVQLVEEQHTRRRRSGLDKFKRLCK